MKRRLTKGEEPRVVRSRKGVGRKYVLEGNFIEQLKEDEASLNESESTEEEKRVGWEFEREKRKEEDDLVETNERPEGLH